MPIEPFEIVKLIIGIMVITIPGYLWSYLFSKQITRLERLVFGFVTGILFFSATPYLLNVFFNITLTQNLIIMIYLLYTIPALLFFLYQWYRSGKHRLQISHLLTRKTILLLGILCFIAFMTFLPHLTMNYYLPFHVDEWIHWSFSRAIMDHGSISFPDPYTGKNLLIDTEIGFHTFTASFSWLSTTTFLAIFLFMQAIFAVFLGLTAYNIGERTEKKFGLEASLLIPLIPTTIRYLGPSFYVAVAVGLLLLLFLVWLIQQKHIPFIILIPPIIWCLFLIHPPTAVASIIVATIYCLMLAVEKNKKIALITGLHLVLTCVPFVLLVTVPTRWKPTIDSILSTVASETSTKNIPAIYVNFNDLGIITWIFFIIGIYYAITKGKSLHLTACFSSIAFIVIIGLFSIFGYGVSILYERSFLYLFLFVTLIAAISLRELRETIPNLLTTYYPHPIIRHDKHLKQTIIPLAMVVLILMTAVPAHLDTSYYKMINEQDYKAFTWIRNNINTYRDANHSYSKAAVHPYKASPFSAITGLYILSSSMHPIIVYWYLSIDDMEAFLADQCRNTSFLNRFKISVIYGSCNNSNLTMIYPNVYIFPNLPS